MDERRSLGRELHDSTAQLLVALQLNMACLKERLDGGPDRNRLLTEIDSLLVELHREVRAVAAIVPGGPLRGRELLGALAEMAASFSLSTGADVVVDVEGTDTTFEVSVESALFRIAQEAVANAVRHGRARQITIRINVNRPGPVMTVDDDGIGIDPEAPAGVGLASIRQRVDQIGGLLSIQRLDHGTRIAVSIPKATPANALMGDVIALTSFRST